MYSSTQAHAVKGSLEAFHSHAGAAILSAAFIPHPYKGSRTLPANTAPLGFPGHLLSLATSRRVLRVHSSLFLLSNFRVGFKADDTQGRWVIRVICQYEVDKKKKSLTGFPEKTYPVEPNERDDILRRFLGGYKGLGAHSL